MVKLHRLLSHAGFYRIQRDRIICHRSTAVFQTFQTLQTCFLLRCSCPASSFCPFQLHTQDALPFSLGCQFHLLPLGFQFQERCVIGIIAVHLSMADLQNPVCDLIQKIAVMCDHNDRSTVCPQIPFQPGDHFSIQMIGGLVQKKQIKVLCQNLCHCHSSLLSAGKMLDLHCMIRDSECIQIALYSPLHIFCHTLHIR